MRKFNAVLLAFSPEHRNFLVAQVIKQRWLYGWMPYSPFNRTLF